MQWNRGGWLGAQLGGSAWMLVAGILSFGEDTSAAFSVIVLFALVNLIGVLLWRRRTRFSAYTATQVLLALLGVSGLLAVYMLERAGVYESIQLGQAISAQSTYVTIVLVVVALMVIFYIRFGRKSPPVEGSH